MASPGIKGTAGSLRTPSCNDSVSLPLGQLVFIQKNVVLSNCKMFHDGSRCFLIHGPLIDSYLTSQGSCSKILWHNLSGQRTMIDLGTPNFERCTRQELEQKGLWFLASFERLWCHKAVMRNYGPLPWERLILRSFRSQVLEKCPSQAGRQGVEGQTSWLDPANKTWQETCPKNASTYFSRNLVQELGLQSEESQTMIEPGTPRWAV